MYKNQLQELAQRSCFNLPSYTCIREGPDHAPRFKATVNFNGEIFESPNYCTTLRQAEHSAAEVALSSLSNRGPSHSLAARILVRVHTLIERSLFRPIIESVTGLSGDDQLTCAVRGRRDELPSLFRSPDLLSHGIEIGKLMPQVVFPLPNVNNGLINHSSFTGFVVMVLIKLFNGQDETGVYKNLLQEISQRVGAPLPLYITFRSGLGHLPVFTCTVELAEITFTGEQAKNKKQAEKNAAMAAWSALKQLAQQAASSSSETENNDEQEQITIARALLNYRQKEKIAMANSQNSLSPFPKKFPMQNLRPSSPQPLHFTTSKILPLICPKAAPRNRAVSITANNGSPPESQFPLPETRGCRLQKFPAAGAAPYVPVQHFRAPYHGIAPPVTIRTAIPVFSTPPLPPPPCQPPQVMRPPPVHIARPVHIRQAVPVFAVPPVQIKEPPTSMVPGPTTRSSVWIREIGSNTGNNDLQESVAILQGMKQLKI
ncbi:hypothetical protein HHK36_016613 [Tetracentron sinense]|uniref:DRBM domain-containing protein n=1 Tax=Tetracentron sinense TaxID=13715 RepID=A0A834Z330_TETSI|nr:hypothetical protein HHK36_016613 [Tetracentron sinense]